jgi:hypothetical protein
MSADQPQNSIYFWSLLLNDKITSKFVILNEASPYSNTLYICRGPLLIDVNVYNLRKN